jgi:hypothetical protein
MKEAQKANLFVVGAMKAGTTSFIELLSRHAQIYCPPVKEPHFFVESLPKSLYEPSRFFNLSSYLEDDFPEPLHITKIETVSQYQQLYSLAKAETYRVDASTAYLHAEEAAERIHEYNSEANIIILLRDPLKRAFSHYKMDLGKGRVKDSFETLLKMDLEQYKNKQLHWYSYLGMSFYNKPIRRYQELFTKVLVISFENLVRNEPQTLGEIASFLEIEPFESNLVKHKNLTRKPSFPKLFYLLKRLGLKDYFSKLFSSTFKQWISRKTSSTETFEMELSEATRKELTQIFSKESQI